MGVVKRSRATGRSLTSATDSTTRLLAKPDAGFKNVGSSRIPGIEIVRSGAVSGWDFAAGLPPRP